MYKLIIIFLFLLIPFKNFAQNFSPEFEEKIKDNKELIIDLRLDMVGQEFQKSSRKYYAGLLISAIGSGLAYYGFWENEETLMLAGGLVSASGAGIMLTSNINIHRAGKLLRITKK